MTGKTKKLLKMENRASQVREKVQWARLRRILNRLWKDICGQDLTEYALLLVLLCLLAVVGLGRLACEIGCVFDVTAQSIDKLRGNLPPGQQIKCTRTCP